jgi:hypothetical protein
MKKLKFAFKIFFAMIFNKPHFVTDAKHFYHSKMSVTDARNIKQTLTDEIENTMNPINLMIEVNDILSEPPSFD